MDEILRYFGTVLLEHCYRHFSLFVILLIFSFVSNKEDDICSIVHTSVQCVHALLTLLYGQVLNFTRFSSKSDVWAYGVLCWEVFTCGEMPYGRAKNPEVVERVQRGQILAQPPSCPHQVYEVSTDSQVQIVMAKQII